MKKKPQDAGVRQTLRRALLEWREGLPREAQSAAAERVNAYLLDWLGARAPTTIGFCWPMRGEIDCRPTIEALIARAWQAVIPVVVALAAPMEFRSWRPGAPMGKDPYGIPIPLTPPAPPPAVLLLPLVAFDAQGYRLGYGGGYFDRTLAALSPRPLTIGVGYAGCEVASIHPAPHDIPLDMIVTESFVRMGAASSSLVRNAGSE